MVVNSGATLLQALTTAQPGDVILLAPGNYGSITIQGIAKAGEVIIASQDPNNPAVISALTVRNASNLTFADIEVSVPPGVAGVFVKDSSNLKFDGMYFHGVLDGVPYTDGSGLSLRDSTNITVTNSEFTDLHGGFSHGNVQGLTATNNYFHLLRSDGIIGNGSNNVFISGNYFTEFYQQPLDHPDCIQFWTTAGSLPTTNITITNNTFVRSSEPGAGPVQGIFMKDEAGTGFQNVVISGNAIIGSSYNAIYMTGGHGVTVTNNLIAGYADMVSWIRITGTDGLNVSNNQSTGWIVENNSPSATGNVTLTAPSIGDNSLLAAWTGPAPKTPTAALGAAPAAPPPPSPPPPPPPPPPPATAPAPATGGSTSGTTDTSGGDLDGVPQSILDQLVTGGGAPRPTVSAPMSLEEGILRGSLSNDTMTGGAGSNELYGDAGDDVIVGGEGVGFLRGEDGNDSLVGGASFDDMHGNAGRDTVSGGGGDDWVVGGMNEDQLYGDEGNDLVYGNLGSDTLAGGGGDDIVRGGKDNDVLNGGAGSDWISGDRGDDTVTGGAGADTFHAFGDAGMDRITDFNVLEGDRLKLMPGSTWQAAQVGTDTVVTVDGIAQVVLAGVSLSSLGDGWISA